MIAKKQKTDDDVRLPESVELCIKRIVMEKLPPPPPPKPLRPYAREMLRDIGEQASLEILNTVLSCKSPITSFSGFVSHLVKKQHPTHADAILSRYDDYSPAHRLLSPPSSASPHTGPKNGESLQPPLSNLQRTDCRNISCQLSFEDEARESRSSIVRDVSLLSREHGEMSESLTISPQLLILNKLKYRKLFLMLSYVGRQKLEDVLTIDDANEVYRMKDLPMTKFETEIWIKYGSKEVDRIQPLLIQCRLFHDGYAVKGTLLINMKCQVLR